MQKLFFTKACNKLRSLIERSVCLCFPLKSLFASLSLKPLGLGFETTNICNANCVFCDYKYMQRSKGVMSMGIFKKALGDFVDIGGGKVGFTPVVGDPLLDSQILERIRYARSFREISHIGFFTNGIALDRFKAEDVLASGVNTLTITFGGFNRNSYRRVFGVDEFEHAYQNILLLATVNMRLSNPVRIELSLRIDRPLSDIAGEPAYKKLAGLIKDISYQYTFDGRSGRIKPEDLPGIMGIKKPACKRSPCFILYADGPTILYNGDVAVCGCREIGLCGELILGNITAGHLITFWHSDALKALRRNFSLGSIPGACIECCDYNDVGVLRTLGMRRLAKENESAYLHSNYARRVQKG